MTNEEAIEIIKSECYVFNPLNFDRSTMVNTALDMAVKALEFDLDKHDEEVIKNTVESIWGEPCEDCVSRQAVLDACDQSINIFAATDRIKDLQSVQPVACVAKVSFDKTELKKIVDNAITGVLPEPQKPEVALWEVCKDEDGIYGVCPVCGTDADFTHYGMSYPYCPNCGAKMEVEDEG